MGRLHHLLVSAAESAVKAAPCSLSSSTTLGRSEVIFIISTHLGHRCSYMSYTYRNHSVPHLGFWQLAKCRHICTFCTWNWGPQLQLWLGYAPMVTIPGNPGRVARAIRSRCVQSDGYNTCPSVGVLMMGARVWRLRSLFAKGHEIIGFRLLASSYSDLISDRLLSAYLFYRGRSLAKTPYLLAKYNMLCFFLCLERKRERQRQRWRGAYYLF